MNKSSQFFLVAAALLIASTLFAQVPSSKRSREAIARVRPQLQRELETKKLVYGSAIFIRIVKESNELELWIKKGDAFERFKTYEICTYGSGVLGPKLKRGDGQAPEGFYSVPPSSLNPLSSFHLSFNLGYPNEYDRAHKRTGSALLVHGKCVSIGCYAMTDPLIEEIYALADAALRNGQHFFKVQVFPFRMTDDNMKKHSGSEWIEFWTNLKEGYDYFEKKYIPPRVTVRNRRYIFE
jgi:murein L,D-transpeptidase YafK